MLKCWIWNSFLILRFSSTATLQNQDRMWKWRAFFVAYQATIRIQWKIFTQDFKKTIDLPIRMVFSLQGIFLIYCIFVYLHLWLNHVIYHVTCQKWTKGFFFSCCLTSVLNSGVINNITFSKAKWFSLLCKIKINLGASSLKCVLACVQSLFPGFLCELNSALLFE